MFDLGVSQKHPVDLAKKLKSYANCITLFVPIAKV